MRRIAFAALIAFVPSLVTQADDSNLLRVETRDLGNGNSLVMIGTLDPTPGQTHGTTSAKTPSQLGFQGQDADSPGFVPRFLVTESSSGPHQVYSFSLPEKSSATGSMPGLLIDLDHSKKSTFKAAPIKSGMDTATTVANVPGLGLADTLWNAFGERSEKQRQQQSQYLSSLITDAINNKDPNLTKLTAALSTQNESGTNGLLKIGTGLSTRYNDGKILVALNKTAKRDGAWDVSVAGQGDKSRTQMTKLTTLATQDGLKVKQLSPDFAMLVYDCGSTLPNKWDHIPLGLPSKEKTFQSQVEKNCTGGATEVPVGIYSVGRNTNIPLLVDFLNPNRQRNQSLISTVRGVSMAALSTAVPVAGLPQNYGNQAIDAIIQKSGSDFGDDKTGAYQALIASGDDGNLNLQTSGLSKQLLQRNLSSIKDLTPAQSAYLTQGINSGDPQALNQLVSILAQHQQGTRALSNPDSNRAKTQATQTANLDALSTYLAAPGNTTQISQQLTAQTAQTQNKDQEQADKKSAKATAKAQAAPPVSCEDPSKTSIVFIVDGLSAERAKSAIGDSRFPTLSQVLSTATPVGADASPQDGACSATSVINSNGLKKFAGFAIEEAQEQEVGKQVIDVNGALSASEKLAKDIESKPGSCQSVINRFEGIDQNTKHLQTQSDASLILLDHSMHIVLDAASKDPCLKGAKTYISLEQGDPTALSANGVVASATNTSKAPPGAASGAAVSPPATAGATPPTAAPASTQ